MQFDWRPTISKDLLRQRAKLLHGIRSFMQSKQILEVETPCLVNAPVTDLHIDNIQTQAVLSEGESYYLHTSPEYAMKRLLAVFNEPVYQLCKVFRRNETGRLHNPEFTMLEWYCPGFDEHDMMQEVRELLLSLKCPEATTREYAEVFFEQTSMNPHTATDESLVRFASDKGLVSSINNRADSLDYIFSHCVLPGLGQDAPELIHAFPACQSALARLSDSNPVTARRFELFMLGMEIANGFYELTDTKEQRQRFLEDNKKRMAAGKTEQPIDERFLSALSSGLPDCSGVALGVDRLLMAMHGLQHINEVMTFPVNRA